LYTVAKIDRDIYRCITDGIQTDEVIITEERIAHIKERHPQDYHKVLEYMTITLGRPDYILRDDREHTGIVIKTVMHDSITIQLVLRIHTSEDETGYKNSVISCWTISNRRLQNYLRNKEILYRKE